MRQAVDPTAGDSQSQSTHPSFSTRILGNIGEELVHSPDDIAAGSEEDVQSDGAQIHCNKDDAEEMGESSEQALQRGEGPSGIRR